MILSEAILSFSQRSLAVVSNWSFSAAIHAICSEEVYFSGKH